MNFIKLLTVYLRYYWQYFKFLRSAKTIYKLDSPYLYDFAKNVIEDKRYYYVFALMEWFRKQLKKDHTQIKVTDFGSGSLIHADNTRKISQLAKHGSISNQEGRLLFRIVRHFTPNTVLELGTSIGISSIYIHAVNKQSTHLTVEGCEALANVAKNNFERLKLKNIHLINVEFDAALDHLLEQNYQLDFCYLDGNHNEKATIRYFKKLLPLFHEKSVLVIADIYWSDSMIKAWESLQKRPEVKLTIDLFHFGLLLFDPKIKEKQNVKLARRSTKPWQLGFRR
ncbi:MAG: class I SAM-dependent methyltransferase [Bacteroidota bacterium]